MKFWIALSEQVEDGWVQVLSPGKVKHPLHGTIDLNPTRFQRFVDNFKAKVRGTDLDVDYDHKMDPAKGKKAAGWFKDLRADDKGLWALVEWTDEAKEAIRKREYRYLSADFHDKWPDQEGKVHTDVLAGAGLTNRPFLKNMLPVNVSLSDLMITEEDSMDPELRKALIGKYKLSENATDADIQAAVTKDAPPAVDVSKASVKWNEDGTGSVTIPGVDGEIKLTAPEPDTSGGDDADVKKLAESNPAIAKLLADREEDRKRLAIVENANRLTEINTQLNDVGGLPPVVLSELREAFVGAPKSFTDKIVDALTKLKNNGFVPEGQVSKTGGPSGDPDGGNAIKQFMDAADKLKADNPKLSEADVYTKLAAEQPDLYRAYDRAVQASEEFEEVN